MRESVFPEVEIDSLLEQVSKPVDVAQTETYQEIGIRSHGKGLFDKEPVTGAQLGGKRVFWIQPDCFVVNIVFAWEQAVGRTTEKDAGKIASHRFPMYRPRDGACDIDFLTYLFKTGYGKDLLALASPGGAGRNKTLGQRSFLKIRVRVPGVTEQRRIAEILSTWDRAIETVEALVANARTQKQALMRDLFTGRRRLPGFSGAWAQTTLGERGRFRKGKGVSRAEVREEGLPCVRYGEIYTQHHDVIRVFHSFIDPDSAAESELIHSGDILFTCSGETAAEIGKCVAFVDQFIAYAGGDIVIFRPGRDCPIFLAYLLNGEDAAAQKSRMGQGKSVVHIGPGNLAKLNLFLPELAEQQAISNVLLGADERISDFSFQGACLRQEKSALMQQLLTGSRRVGIVRGLAK
jgi:type I restriction enzyme S subunit